MCLAMNNCSGYPCSNGVCQCPVSVKSADCSVKATQISKSHVVVANLEGLDSVYLQQNFSPDDKEWKLIIKTADNKVPYDVYICS